VIRITFNIQSAKKKQFPNSHDQHTNSTRFKKQYVGTKTNARPLALIQLQEQGVTSHYPANIHIGKGRAI
jgi:hypothetical protein